MLFFDTPPGALAVDFLFSAACQRLNSAGQTGSKVIHLVMRVKYGSNLDLNPGCAPTLCDPGWPSLSHPRPVFDRGK